MRILVILEVKWSLLLGEHLVIATSVEIKLMNENFSYTCSEMIFAAGRALSDYYKRGDQVNEWEF